MSLFLGTIVRETINLHNEYTLEILIEIKHYLALQTSIIVDDTPQWLKISSLRKLSSDESNTTNEFFILKNFIHLFTQWQRVEVENEQDLEFFDVCYECLMIIKEHLPIKISIGVEIIEDLVNEPAGLGTENEPLSLVEFVENFENEKNEEFCRRINSNFKTLIENMLYLSQHFYYYKNKLNALRFLAEHENIRHEELVDLDDKLIEFLVEISIDEDFREYSTRILEKIELAKEILINKKFKNSNLENSKEHLVIEENSNSSSLSSSETSKEQLNNNNSQFFNKSNYNKKQSNHEKEFRSSEANIPNSNLENCKENLKENENLFEIINRQPLKLFNKTIKEKEYDTIINTFIKNISPKSILFQLKESQNLKRLTMLINCASEFNFNDIKMEHKVYKEIQNVCNNFLKSNYSIQFTKTINEHSYEQFDENNKNEFQEQLIKKECMRFYESVQKYFFKKCYLINKSDKTKKEKSMSKMKEGEENKERNDLKLLDKVNKKIQNEFNCYN